MHNALRQSLEILAVTLTGSFYVNADEPPTRKERDDIADKLSKEEIIAKEKKESADKADELLLNLGKSIDALDKTVPLLLKTVEGKAKDDPARIEAEKLKEMLDKLKALKTKTEKENAAGRKDANLLQVELNKTLKDYFSKADPKMVAERFGVEFDGIDFNGLPQFLERTVGTPPPLRYGLGAEHTWNDRVGGDPYWGGGIVMKSISQHEQVTTRDMYDTAKHLLQKKIPGIQPLIGRVGMTHNIDELKAKPDAYKNIFGNQSFTPTVMNNSTRDSNDLEKPEEFRDLMSLYTRGDKTKTLKMPGAEITYGLPPIGRPILMNSGGNGGWNDRPNFTMQKNFYPNRLNIGSTSQAPLKDADRCDPKAPIALEDYCSASYTDAMIRRPCWEPNGERLKTRYINPKYKEIISDNLWKLAGKANGKDYKGTPTDVELADEVMYPPALVKAVKADIEMYSKTVVDKEGMLGDGFHRNLRGTSFAAPVAAGVMYAASVLYPDASEAELTSAFLASCQPVYFREPDEGKPAVDDLLYMTDKKTGWAFSPRGGGYGEFVICDTATEKSPDSWMRMQQYLEAMRVERMKMTKNGKAETTVEVGDGPDKRKTIINGKPQPMTIELKKLKVEPPSAAMIKEDKRLYDAIVEACTKSDMHACTSVIGSEIMPLMEKKDYKAALEKYEEQYVKSGFVSATDPFYEDIKKAVKEADTGRRFTYSIRVPEGHDMLTTFASLRLKFEDNARTDRFIVLESPDGRKVPVTLSDAHSGVEIGSTSGFMNNSARGNSKSGTWKIHTLNELSTSDSSIVLAGTERNVDLGIVDVRETVLTKAIEKEADARTKVPAKNLLALPDPHVFLRDWNGITPKKEVTPKKEKIVLKPATYEDQREYMQELLEKSELMKGGFLPKGTKLLRPDIKTPAKDKAIMDMFDGIFKRLMPGAKPSSEGPVGSLQGIQKNWGALATAIAAEGDQDLDIQPQLRLPTALVNEQAMPDAMRDLLKPLLPLDKSAASLLASSSSSFEDMANGTWVRPSQLPEKPATLAGDLAKQRKTAVS